MPIQAPKEKPAIQQLLASGEYVADRSLATSLFLALAMRRPLFLEGEAGVGKTEIGKVVAQALGRELIRLQCYEGLDISQAAYEWNYSRQMIEIRLAEAAGVKDKDKLGAQIYSDQFLVKRPLARALEANEEGDAPVLLIDELDRTDEPFEAYLLEVLSDWQITIPEIGTLKAKEPPIVVITSNRTREIHDAVKRRCFYHWVDYPDAQRELEILRRKAPNAAAAAFASPTRRSASSPATRSRSSRYLSSTPSVLLTVSGSSATRSSATRQFAQSMVSATPGSLKSSVLRSRCTKATTSFDSAALALGALRCRISSSRRASG